MSSAAIFGMSTSTAPIVMASVVISWKLCWANDAQDRAEHGADEDGLAEDADLLLKTREVDVDVTDAGLVVDDLLSTHAIGANGRGEGVGD